MKKIVALALSLVMVMGLATTAFAATAGSDLTEALGTEAAGYTVEVKAAAPAVESAKMFATYQLYFTNKETKAVTVAGPYTELASADGAQVTFVDGKVIRYFAEVATYDVAVKAVKVEAQKNPTCGKIFAEKDTTYYVDDKGVYYATGTDVVGNVGGKALGLEAVGTLATLMTPHTFDWDVASVTGEQAISKVFCTECKKSFSFIDTNDEAEAVAKFGAGNYMPAFAGIEGTVYVAIAGASAGTTGETVESAKTFDAGIAMYVGMSVMAAAGSAVVLKKKD